MLHSENTIRIRRAKPLLGTIVDITVTSATMDNADLHALLVDCFTRVHEIHRMMSYFEGDSEVSRLNAAEPEVPIAVSAETSYVLRLAQQLSGRTGGAFDVLFRGRREYPTATLLFHGEHAVSRSHPAPIDLGGIAKGFAVDQAAQVIARHPGVSGVVNGGGDIRFVGTEYFPLSIRSPRHDGRYVEAGVYRDCAVATSVVPGATAHFSSEPISISVIAPSCIIADSLTKAVAYLQRAERRKLLREHNALCRVFTSTLEEITEEYLQ